jgi:hypothetical protein
VHGGGSIDDGLASIVLASIDAVLASYSGVVGRSSAALVSAPAMAESGVCADEEHANPIRIGAAKGQSPERVLSIGYQ